MLFYRTKSVPLNMSTSKDNRSTSSLVIEKALFSNIRTYFMIKRFDYNYYSNAASLTRTEHSLKRRNSVNSTYRSSLFKEQALILSFIVNFNLENLFDHKLMMLSWEGNWLLESQHIEENIIFVSNRILSSLGLNYVFSCK